MVKILKLPHGKDLPTPKHATPSSAGMDLYAAIDQDIVVAPGDIEIVPTGIAIVLEENMEAQIRPRSGLAAKHGVSVINTPGTIDADYRGEIKAILINHGKEDFVISRGMRIAQMVIANYLKIELQEVESLDEETDRGTEGLGSTGY